MSEFDLISLDQLEIRSRNNSNGRYRINSLKFIERRVNLILNVFCSNEDLTNGKGSYDTLDDCQSQFDLEQNGTSKLKTLKKPVDKFFIKETIYELDDIDNFNDDMNVPEEVETKRYKCSSPRRRHNSVRSQELDFEFDDEELRPPSEESSTTPVDMPDSQRHSRTYSNSSETDE